MKLRADCQLKVMHSDHKFWRKDEIYNNQMFQPVKFGPVSCTQSCIGSIQSPNQCIYWGFGSPLGFQNNVILPRLKNKEGKKNNNKVYQSWKEKGIWHPFSFPLFFAGCGNEQNPG